MRPSIVALLLILALTLIGLAACGGSAASTAPGGQADPIAGEALFKLECASCHSVLAGVDLAGPSLAGISAQGDQSLREAIVNPDAEVTSGYDKGIMPDSFGKQLTAQQIDDLVAYLLILK
jgi:mono/diheme cytochrome c family protein